MFDRRKKSGGDGAVSDVNSRLIQGLFDWQATGGEDERIVRLCLTQLVECYIDKFERRFPRDVGAEPPRLEWAPAEGRRGVVCRGVIDGSTPAHFLPVVVNLHDEFLPARITEGLLPPELEATGRPFLGYLSCHHRVASKSYFLDLALWGSRGSLIDKFKSAFDNAARSQRAYVDLQCDFLAVDPIEFINTIKMRGFSERLAITEVRLVDDLTLASAAMWTWREQNG